MVLNDEELQSTNPRDNGDDQEKQDLETSPNHNIDLGLRGENAAARYLEKRGYHILERNWVCFAGEADIIARDGDTLVFVEVKTRSSFAQGFPSEAVTGTKRDRYERIALAYLADSSFADIPVRFDVIAIVAMSNDRAMIRHHINAFSMDH